MTLLAEPPRTSAPAEGPAAPRNGEEFLASLGGVPLHRVLFDPPPGTVTGAYYEQIDGRVDDRLVELVNGTLVEKAVGMNESRVAMNLVIEMGGHVRSNKLGFIAGPDGTVKMAGGNRRMPDVAVYLRSDYPNGVRPAAKVPEIPPRIAVEVLSADNTASEIAMKLREYFASGCRLAYVIDPAARTARRHTAPDEFTEITPAGTLDGGDVLPGFEAKLAELFEE